ncbi:MAG: endonuclease/exonuclease/phosphatase family protein [Ilumatobacteraceae bacterium]
MGETLRVMTLNILGPPNLRWPERRERLGALRPDVIALQEVMRTDEYDGVVDLLGADYAAAWFSERSDDGVGGALASRWPMRTLVELDYRVTPRHPDLAWCATLIAEIDTPVGALIAVHHKPTWPFGDELQRELVAVRAARAVEDLLDGEHRHVVLLGDLDAPPDPASVQFLTGRRSLDGTSVYFQDAWTSVHGDELGFTFDSASELVRAGEVATALSRRIDYVQVRGGRHGPTLRAVDCRLAFAEADDGLHASDHFGVVADLTVPDHPPGTWAEGWS